MPKPTLPKPVRSCGCRHCPCRQESRCRCHDYNALLALALWDYGRSLSRRKNSR